MGLSRTQKTKEQLEYMENIETGFNRMKEEKIL